MNKHRIIKYYKEPERPYVCMSTVLFLKDSYFKISRGNSKEFSNVNKTKQQLFIINLKENVRMLDEGIYPSDFYLRIYYDKTISKNKEFRDFLKELKKNKKVQLVRFEYEEYLNASTDYETHMELYGTMIRFHPIFQENTNIKYVLLIDSDNIYLKNYLKIYNDFVKSKKLVHSISPITQLNFNSVDVITNKKITEFDYKYLLGGLTMFKKDDSIFTKSLWNKYFNNMFEQTDLKHVFDYLDFKRVAINSITREDPNVQKLINLKIGKETQLEQSMSSNNTIEAGSLQTSKKPDLQLRTLSYNSFNYGVDEIWLNYVIKKILRENNKEDELSTTYTSNFNIKMVLNRILILLIYNNYINYKQFELFMLETDFKTFDELKAFLIKLINDKKLELKDFKTVLKIFTNNKFTKSLYLQTSLKYIINNFKDLVNKRSKYHFYSITSQKK